MFARPSKDSTPPWSIQCGCHQGYSELCVAYKFVCLVEKFFFVCVCGKLSREKSFVNFEVFWLFLKVFFTKFGGMVSFGGTSKQLTEIFSVKIIFSLENFPLYGCKFTILCYDYDSLSCVNLVHFVGECIFQSVKPLFVPPPPRNLVPRPPRNFIICWSKI